MAEKIFKEIEEIPERDDEALDMLKRRLVVVAVLVMIFTALIIARLWYLQINSGEEYKERAFNNRVRIRQVAAPRGHIIDRTAEKSIKNEHLTTASGYGRWLPPEGILSTGRGRKLSPTGPLSMCC